jgi:hypothetical protein
MSGATMISTEDASGAPEVNPWLIGMVLSLSAFMEDRATFKCTDAALCAEREERVSPLVL